MKPYIENKYSWILLSYLVLVPIFVIPFTFKTPVLEYWFVDYFILPKVVLLIVITIISLLALYKLNDSSQLHKRYTCDEIFLLTYLIIIILSTIFSIDPFTSIIGESFYNEGLIIICCYALIFLFTKEHYRFSESHLFYISSSIFALVIIGFLQFCGLDFFRGEFIGSVYSTFRNPNYYGTYLVLVLPLMIYMYIVKSNFLYLAISDLALWCLLSTNTRGAWLGFIWILLLLGVFSYFLKLNINNIIILLSTFILVTLIFNTVSDGQAMKRFSSITNDFSNTLYKDEGFEKSGANRIFIWMGTVELIKEKPFLGHGLETFSSVFNSKFSKLSEEKFGRRYHFFKAHNEYLNIAQSSGIPSLIIYLIFVVYVVLKSYRKVFKNNHYLPIFLGVQGYLVQAFFNVSIVGVAQIYWLFLGLLMNDKLFNKNIDGFQAPS